MPIHPLIIHLPYIQTHGTWLKALSPSPHGHGARADSEPFGHQNDVFTIYNFWRTIATFAFLLHFWRYPNKYQIPIRSKTGFPDKTLMKHITY
jgi:hypothetical protein